MARNLYLFASSCLAMAFAAGWAGAQANRRPSWDQNAAEAKVRRVLEVEKGGAPWDKVAWLTDPNEAVRRARAQSKPVFVYFYLRKQAGPPTAPC